MLTPPPIPNRRIAEHIHAAYDLAVALVRFLPIGADVNTAAYRVESGSGAPFFFKLRKDNFNETSLLIPYWLHENGLQQVIPPLKTRAGTLWERMDGYAATLYPFVTGKNAWDSPLSDAQWVEFGAALRWVHGADLPQELRARIALEDFSPRWRDVVRRALADVEAKRYIDRIAAQMAEVMQARRGEITGMVARAEVLAAQLQAQPPEFVLCHSDIHGGNLLLSEDGALYIVDWDEPILAPRERDLMFIGGGIGGTWDTPREEALFYQGYGQVAVHRPALLYYRYERIVADIAVYCQTVLEGEGESDDRRQELEWFKSIFGAGGVLDIARETEKREL
jgi:spectinomycin phosphotransferase